MKTVKFFSMAVVLLSSMALLSCKDKPADETEDTNVEMAVDTTGTTGQPVPDTVPGVTSGVGDEQIP